MKKIKNSNVATLAAATLTPETIEVEGQTFERIENVQPDTTPSTPAVETLPVSTLVTRDSFGFGANTETSFILAKLLEGTHTRKAIEDVFLARFAGEDASQVKAKKTTFSVFLSDVKRPIGVYHASRGLTINKSDEGVLSVDPATADVATKAIAAGILQALKGITPKAKYPVYSRIMGEFGLAVEPKKK